MSRDFNWLNTPPNSVERNYCCTHSRCDKRKLKCSIAYAVQIVVVLLASHISKWYKLLSFSRIADNHVRFMFSGLLSLRALCCSCWCRRRCRRRCLFVCYCRKRYNTTDTKFRILYANSDINTLATGSHWCRFHMHKHVRPKTENAAKMHKVAPYIHFIN